MLSSMSPLHWVPMSGKCSSCCLLIAQVCASCTSKGTRVQITRMQGKVSGCGGLPVMQSQDPEQAGQLDYANSKV